MIRIKKFIFLILVFFTFTNLGFSKISLQIVMKIDNEIVTSYDIEQEVNYLVALNSQLKEVNLSQLKQIAKKINKGNFFIKLNIIVWSAISNHLFFFLISLFS